MHPPPGRRRDDRATSDLELREATHEDAVRTYLRVLNRRKFTIILVTVIVLALAIAYVEVKTPVYTASAQVLVPEQAATSALQPTANAQTPTVNVQRLLSDAQQFAQGNQTKAAAQAILHGTPKVTITASTTDDVLTFAATSANRGQAANVANAYSRAYISADRANQVGQYTGQVTALHTSIGKLQRQVASAQTGSQQRAADRSSISSLTQSLQQLQAASQLVAQTGPTVINAASVPTAPSSPKKVRDGVLGLVVGLVLGVALAFLRDRLDDKVKSTRDIEDVSGGLPIVGSIPLVSSWRKGKKTHIALMEDADSTVSEAYRTLRTSIQFLGIDEVQRVIAVTSSTPDEGKSTATANLAVSFARAGQRVVVVSFDFRRPRLHLFFGLDNQVGATSVLLGQSTLADALREVPGESNLRVLSSGPVPPNPAEILSLDRVRQLVDVLADNADVVLLDCPPVLPVTDTLLVSRLCDTMLVLTVAASTKRGDLSRTYELLAQVQAPVRGTIVNRVPSRGAYASGYGYGYGYGYESASYQSSPPSTAPTETQAAATDPRAFTRNDAAAPSNPSTVTATVSAEDRQAVALTRSRGDVANDPNAPGASLGFPQFQEQAPPGKNGSGG